MNDVNHTTPTGATAERTAWLAADLALATTAANAARLAWLAADAAADAAWAVWHAADAAKRRAKCRAADADA